MTKPLLEGAPQRNKFIDNGAAPHRLARMSFASVYVDAAAAMVGTLVYAYSREQRTEKEWRLRRTQGFRPVARLNLIGRK